MRTNRVIRFSVAATVLAAATTTIAAPPGTSDSTFTYQGEYWVSDQPFTGNVSLTFSLWTEVVGGSQIGTSIESSLNVSSGIFTAALDFGPNAFDSGSVWLNIAETGGSSFVPRQAVTSAPHAISTRGLTVESNGDATLADHVFVDQVNSFVGINRSNRITAAEHFGIDAPGSGYGGMYLNTPDAGGVAFYGYAHEGSFTAWHSYHPAESAWQLHVDGSPHLTVTDSGDTGIGTTSPTARLNVAANIGPALDVSSSSARLLVDDNFVGINRDTPVTGAEAFGVTSQATGTFGGMYMDCANTSTDPFYGYSRGGALDAYHYYDGTTEQWRLYAGGERIAVAALTGFVGFGVTNPVQPLQMASGAFCSQGGTWFNASSEKLKENFGAVDFKRVLQSLNELEIAQWNYKSEGDDVVHIGPTAESFRAAFGLGETDEAIATVDADGVALAAIKGLYEMLEEKTDRVDALDRENAELRALLTEFADRLEHLERHQQ